MTNFDSSKTDLSLKYRLGLEQALAKADFLNVPDLVLVQAFGLFICLARRHDSPRFIYMMTGLVIRMAQYLGLQRDGTHFPHLTPFEIEMRRRVWWGLSALDVRAAEDQGTDLTIPDGFDTRIPLNINDADIGPETKQTPEEHQGVTDMTFARINCEINIVSRQLMKVSASGAVPDLEQQSRLINEIKQKCEQEYFQYTTGSEGIVWWVADIVGKLVMCKLTLTACLPALFSSLSEGISEEIRTKLFLSAIELAEYNHMLNCEEACRQYRWMFQVYSHWYAIVYLMIEIIRRPWSATVERAWVALHSKWLIPGRGPIDMNLRIWVPLRKMMDKARRHRDAELDRLRRDPHAAARLDAEDRAIPLPSSSGLLEVDAFRERWRQLTNLPETPVDDNQKFHTTHTNQPMGPSTPANNTANLGLNSISQPTSLDPGRQRFDPPLDNLVMQNSRGTNTTDTPSHLSPGNTYNPFPTFLADWSDSRTMGPEPVSWPLTQPEPSTAMNPDLGVDFLDAQMDLDPEMNWYSWVESIKGMEWDAEASASGWS